MRTFWRILAVATLQSAVASSAWSQTDTNERPLAIVLAAGDIAKCKSQGKDQETAAIIQSAYEKATQDHIPVYVLALGDLAYDHGSEDNFKCFAKTWGSPERFPLLLPVPGNHDYETNRAKPYFDFFKKLPIVESNGAGSGYYSVSITASGQVLWQLYGLNAYADGKTRSRQLRWLTQQLRQSAAPCVLAFWHPFLFSSGYHGHRDNKKPNARIARGNMMAAAFGLLQKYGASVVLTGHDHDFEQFGRQDVNGHKRANGIRSFVIGTGGGGLYQVKYNNRAPNSEYFANSTYGVLQMNIYPSKYTWDFLPISGSKRFELNPKEDRCNARSSQ